MLTKRTRRLGLAGKRDLGTLAEAAFGLMMEQGRRPEAPRWRHSSQDVQFQKVGDWRIAPVSRMWPEE